MNRHLFDFMAILSFAICEIRQMVNSCSKEIIVPFYPDIQLENIQYVIPQRGDKKQLLELSERNANFFRLDRERQRGMRKENPTLCLVSLYCTPTLPSPTIKITFLFMIPL